MNIGPLLRRGAFFGLVIILWLLPLAISDYYLGLVIQVMIYGLFAMSLDILLGYAGLPSLGHAAYFGIAGYTVAILSRRVSENFGLVLASSIGVTSLFSIAFALVAIRTHGAYFMMMTLALAQLLWAIAVKWRSLTGGDDGLPGIPRPRLGPVLSLGDTPSFYFFILILFLLLAGCLSLLIRSPFGLTLRGIRENEKRMLALGYDVWLYKCLAFVISGIFAGLAGALFTYYNGFVSPSALSLALSAKVLLMVILGGAGTLFGPVLGAAVVVFLENLVSSVTERWLFILGAFYVAVALCAPTGILGTLGAMWRRSAKR